MLASTPGWHTPSVCPRVLQLSRSLASLLVCSLVQGIVVSQILHIHHVVGNFDDPVMLCFFHMHCFLIVASAFHTDLITCALVVLGGCACTHLHARNLHGEQ